MLQDTFIMSYECLRQGPELEDNWKYQDLKDVNASRAVKGRASELQDS